MESVYIIEPRGMLEWLYSMVCILLGGFCIYRLFVRYIQPRQNWICKLVLFAAFGISSFMPIWLGDENLLLTAPPFIGTVMLCTQGNRYGRLCTVFTFFCLEMSLSAFFGTYLEGVGPYTGFSRMAFDGYRCVSYILIFFYLKRKLPEKWVYLPKRLWKILFWFSLMPLGTLATLVTLGMSERFGDLAYVQVRAMGLVILPSVFLTSFTILAAVSALADYEQMERTVHLLELREDYYESLRQEETRIRHIRHDIKNHLFTIRELLAGGKPGEAAAYLDGLLGEVQPGQKARFCENEAVNALLCSKVDLILQKGLDYDFRILLEERISIADIDLCSLIGKALDNAIRAAVSAEDQKISLRCRCDKGMFMLKVVNGFGGEIDGRLKTTKPDSGRHGFGIPGMREIAARYGGSLEAKAQGDRFVLAACMPLRRTSEQGAEGKELQ